MLEKLLPEIVAGIIGAASAWGALRFKVGKAQADIKGLSIREAENTKRERRRFVLRIASDLDAAAPENMEVKRLAQLLREDASN